MTAPKWPTDFGPVPLPSWIKPDDRWKSQLEVATQIVDAFNSNDVVFLQAPTGAGKTLIAELVRRLMNVRAVYTCSTKALQDQFARDYPYAKVLKGRTNYLPETGETDSFGYALPDSHVTCADCNWDIESGVCSWCSSKGVCPYVIARSRAELAPLAVLNSSYLLTDATKGMGRFVGRDLTILDEADTMESELLNQVEVVLTERRMAKLAITPPTRKTVASAWEPWASNVAIPAVGAYLDSLPDPYETSATPRDIREYQRTERLLASLHLLARELPNGGWVYDGYDRNNVIFRPVKVARYGNDYIWQHGQKFLAMSATILSADLMVDELGLCYHRDTPYTMIDLPSTYPVENRPIHIAPVANMTYKNKATAWPSMVRAINGVLRLHPDERVLVHTVSYELARFLEANLVADRPFVTYTDSSQKESALNRYKKHPNSVLLAASMDRGIDLPDDLCRVQVLAKVPWPNTADKRINARIHTKGGQSWYRMQTVRTIMQMVGRGIRSKDDFATTYILDQQFSTNLWQNSEYMFPKWWKESINWRFNKRKLM